MRRLTLLWIPFLLAWSETAPAQEAQPSFCYRARPKSVCSAFAFTNFGTYLVLGSDITSGDTPLRAVADWGVMANVDSRNAIGASVFASLDRLGVGVGPAVHYRRWLSSTASVDVAVGTPLLAATDHLRSGSVFGLVRWSPNHWFSLAERHGGDGGRRRRTAPEPQGGPRVAPGERRARLQVGGQARRQRCPARGEPRQGGRVARAVHPRPRQHPVGRHVRILHGARPRREPGSGTLPVAERGQPHVVRHDEPQIALPLRPRAGRAVEAKPRAVRPAGRQVRREPHAQRAHPFLIGSGTPLEAAQHGASRPLALCRRAERRGLKRQVLERREAVPARVVQ